MFTVTDASFYKSEVKWNDTFYNHLSGSLWNEDSLNHFEYRFIFEASHRITFFTYIFPQPCQSWSRPEKNSILKSQQFAPKIVSPFQV